jgi:hypothetical protein
MDDRNLPLSYGRTRLVLLAVDPYLIHAYWEVTPEKLIEAKAEAGEAQAVLRFYKARRVADESAPVDWFDVEIDLQSPNWYAHLWSAEESYYADLALRRNDGTLIRLVRSQLVQMPRTRPAIAIEQRFMKVRSTGRLAEIVSPPAVLPRPQPAAADLPNELKQPTARPVDSAEIVRETLREVYASRHWRRQRLSSEGVRAPKISNLPPASPTIDLTAMAETRLSAGISSGMLQSFEGGTDKK